MSGRDRVLLIAAIVVSLYAVIVTAPWADAKPRKYEPQVTYVDCHNGAHLWVTEQGGIYGVPAGSECP